MRSLLRLPIVALVLCSLAEPAIAHGLGAGEASSTHALAPAAGADGGAAEAAPSPTDDCPDCDDCSLACSCPCCPARTLSVRPAILPPPRSLAWPAFAPAHDDGPSAGAAREIFHPPSR